MGIKLKIIAGLSLLLIIGSLTTWAHWEKAAKEKAEKAAETAQDRLAGSERNRKVEQALQAGVALIDQIRTEQLNEALSEIDDLRGRVLTGAVELRVGAKCETPVSRDARDTSVGDGARPRLTDAARRHYFTLRERIERVTGQLTACQDILREIKKEPSEEG